MSWCGKVFIYSSIYFIILFTWVSLYQLIRFLFLFLCFLRFVASCIFLYEECESGLILFYFFSWRITCLSEMFFIYLSDCSSIVSLPLPLKLLLLLFFFFCIKRKIHPYLYPFFSFAGCAVRSVCLLICGDMTVPDPPRSRARSMAESLRELKCFPP